MTATPHRTPQRGAALVVGLVLLVILTLLAISGMNTATVELTMAGNEQYQSRAFQAAETGIERVITTGAFVPTAETNREELIDTPAPDELDDRYSATTRPRGSSTAPPGYSVGEFNAEHFEIESTGTSLRNASSTSVQGLYLVVPSGS